MIIPPTQPARPTAYVVHTHPPPVHPPFRIPTAVFRSCSVSPTHNLPPSGAGGGRQAGTLRGARHTAGGMVRGVSVDSQLLAAHVSALIWGYRFPLVVGLFASSCVRRTVPALTATCATHAMAPHGVLSDRDFAAAVDKIIRAGLGPIKKVVTIDVVSDPN